MFGIGSFSKTIRIRRQRILALPPISWVTLGTLLNLSELQVSSLYPGVERLTLQIDVKSVKGI